MSENALLKKRLRKYVHYYYTSSFHSNYSNWFGGRRRAGRLFKSVPDRGHLHHHNKYIYIIIKTNKMSESIIQKIGIHLIDCMRGDNKLQKLNFCYRQIPYFTYKLI